MKIFDIPVIQRKISYRPHSRDKNDISEEDKEIDRPVDLVNGVESAEIVDVATVLQVESYRSLMHLYTHIVEQMMRYFGDGN